MKTNKRQGHIRKREIAVLLAVAVLIGGCSGYYEAGTGQTEEEPSETSPEQTAAPTIEDAVGPGGGVPGSGSVIIDSLEVPDSGRTGRQDRAMNPEIFIASDIHYLAKELTDFDEAFMQMSENGDGKAVPYVWEILDTFLDVVVERKPQILILSGDLSLEGEYLSHQALARKLIRAEKAGVEVVVIPGNHDINNSAAAAYQGEAVVPAETTSPEQFAEIYAEFGYDEAVSRDPASLSYIYETPDGTWLLLLDSCQYESGYQVGGMIRPETYEWLEPWLKKAWNENRQVITVAHHNLLDESRIYEKDCTIEHSEELERLLDEWGVTLFLSGHLHVQHYRSSESGDIEEIVTGCLSMSPCQYGVLKYFSSKTYDYHTEQLDVKAWAKRHDNPDVNLEDFDNYAREYLREAFYQKAFQALDGKQLSEEDRDAMADFYAYMNVYSVAGKAVEVRDEALESWGYMVWKENNLSDIQSMYLDEILEDAVCDYNVFRRDDE